MSKDFFKLEIDIINMLKTIFDPEIPVNIYDLGLIYNIDIDDNNNVQITMTLTAPNCPLAGQIVLEVQTKVSSIMNINAVDVNLVFEPMWHADMMSEEAKLELGYL